MVFSSNFSVLPDVSAPGVSDVRTLPWDLSVSYHSSLLSCPRTVRSQTPNLHLAAGIGHGCPHVNIEY